MKLQIYFLEDGDNVILDKQIFLDKKVYSNGTIVKNTYHLPKNFNLEELITDASEILRLKKSGL